MKAGLKRAKNAWPLEDNGRREYHLSNPTSATAASVRRLQRAAFRSTALRSGLSRRVAFVGDGRVPRRGADVHDGARSVPLSVSGESFGGNRQNYAFRQLCAVGRRASQEPICLILSGKMARKRRNEEPLLFGRLGHVNGSDRHFKFRDAKERDASLAGVLKRRHGQTSAVEFDGV